PTAIHPGYRRQSKRSLSPQSDSPTVKLRRFFRMRVTRVVSLGEKIKPCRRLRPGEERSQLATTRAIPAALGFFPTVALFPRIWSAARDCRIRRPENLRHGSLPHV